VAATVWWVTGPLLPKYLLKQEMLRMKPKKKLASCIQQTLSVPCVFKIIKQMRANYPQLFS